MNGEYVLFGPKSSMYGQLRFIAHSVIGIVEYNRVIIRFKRTLGESLDEANL